LHILNVKKISVLTLVVAIYIFLTFFKFSGLMSYIVPSVCWSLLIIIALYIFRIEKIHLWVNRQLIVLAALTAGLQIVALIFVSFFTSFGRSPYQFTPIAITINMTYFLSSLFALELSRSYLIKSIPKKKIFLEIGLISLFYTFISLPMAKFAFLGTPTDTAKFLGSDFLPTLAQSLFATYLVLLGGPTTSIAYLGTLQAFEWLSPILPNPTWSIRALITTLAPTIGFLAINQTVTPFTLIRFGIINRSEAANKKCRAHAKKSSSTITWTTIAIIAVILVWGSTGLLGFQPNITASGSMTPTLNVGDIAITVQTSPSNIKVGDIIQYWREGEPGPIIHRVIEIYRSGGTTYFITKGDANNAPDDPITPTQTVGKLVITIPKLGWISIYLKTFIANAWAFLTNNPAIAYITITITSATSILGIHRYRNQPLRKLRRRLGR